MDLEKAEMAVYQLLEALGENPNREGLRETPSRVVRMYQEMWQGLGKNPKSEFTAVFNEGNGEAVIVRNIPFYSMCEHHLVPFYGKVHIAYLPNSDGQVTGLSKLARCVEVVSKRPQVQERLTTEIADGIEQALKPQGVYVFVEAEHMCMTMRGIKKPGSKTITTTSRGCYRKDAQLRQELLSLLKLE
ncbi:GTP cyclohydrolase I FolE [Streptococcus sciuri]|uniref:GTP cyclohydrolase 1 n=1 Tax=Streptococcus sciuri TaxID=2973939 RepID=A0ABT2F5E7_9STRE|nr:GTP cyclohydrolase I FolE [Streptococcus sciuri]MCS4487674.1 GTP cyclohydrolase I FolE [Streptococcus sciuri]